MQKMWLIIIIPLITTSANAITINEIMYNPDGSDNNREFIEIYSDNWVNLTNYVIEDLSSNDSLILIQFYNGSYSLIVEEEFNYTNINATIYSVGLTIGNGLNNDGDNITLKDVNSIPLDNVYYTNSIGGDDNNKTICRIPNGNGSFQECEPTPGEYNDATESSGTRNLLFDINLNNTVINLGETLLISGEFTNTYNRSISGNLIIKIGNKTNEGYEYPDQWILFDASITISNTTISLSDLLKYNITWIPPNNCLSNNYKVYARFQSNIQDRYPYEIFQVIGLANVFISNWNLTLNKLTFTNNTTQLNIQITNNESSDYNFNLSIFVNNLKTVSSGIHDNITQCGNFDINANSSLEINCNWSIPKDTITNGTEDFDIYPRISFYYKGVSITKNGDEENIYLIGLEDLGEPEFEIISYPNLTRFGDFKTVFTRYKTNNYNYPLKFLAYGYPKQILMDLSENGVTASSYDSNIAVNITNTQRNQNLYVTIPLLFKENCDNYYETGVYRIRVRAYKPDNNIWSEIETLDFNLTIDGRNEIRCEKEVQTVSKSPLSSSSSSIKKKDELYEIISFKDKVKIGEEFDTMVKLENKDNKAKILEVYSYVYDNNKILSLGFNGGGWKGTWTANKQEVSLNPKSSKTTILKNKIKDNIEPNKYKFKVRIKEGDKNDDIIRDIEVIKPEGVQSYKKYNVEFNCRIIDNKSVIYIDNNNSDNLEAYVLSISPEKIETQKVSIGANNKTVVVLKKSPERQYYFLIKDNLIISNCTLEHTHEEEIENKITGRTIQRNKIIEWFISLIERYLGGN